MATATATAGGLEARIVEQKRKIVEAEQSLESVVHELSGAEDVLQQLQSERHRECIDVALGKAKANPERLDRTIQATKDRITGLEGLKRRKEVALVDCRVALHDLTAEASRLENERAITAEGDETRLMISVTETAIETRNDAERKIGEGIHRLRSKKYLSEAHRRIAADAAFRLDRIRNGMRP